jgi:peptidoglycan/LPS O-acetylase OafA/YrhL
MTIVPPTWPENWRYLHCVGAFLLAYSTSSTNISALRKVFENRIAAYLGRISYAMYLMHGPIMHMLGAWLVPWCWRLVGYSIKDEIGGMWEKEVGFLMAFVVMTATVVGCADLFQRLVDARCIAFAKWVEKKVVMEE